MGVEKISPKSYPCCFFKKGKAVIKETVILFQINVLVLNILRASKIFNNFKNVLKGNISLKCVNEINKT